jgi:hypothetical protein
VEQRLRVFIGSSSEQLPVARAIQANLEPYVETVVWDQGVFQLSATAIESLIERLRKTDVAVFVFGPDDVTVLRGHRHRTTRDYVVFELGLFTGALGRNRCFLVIPVGTEGLRIPSDLAGITYATYVPNRSDGNYRAALGPASDQIIQQLHKPTEKSDYITTYRSFQSQLINWEELFESSSSLDVLFFGSNAWRSHHFLRLQHFCSKPNASIRVLIPDPANPSLVLEMANGYDGNLEYAQGRLDSAVVFFSDLAREYSTASISVFGISRLPLFALFRFDEQALLSFYSHQGKLMAVPTVLCRRQDHTFKFAIDEFEELLCRAKTAGRKLV